MKKIISILTFMFLVNMCFAQNVQVTWGPELKDPKKTQITDILGRNEKYFFALRMQVRGADRGNYIIDCYDNKTLDLLYSREIEEELKDRVKDAGEMKAKNLNIEQVFMVEDKIILLVSYYDTKADKKTLFASHVKQSDGSLSGELMKVDEILDVKKSSKGAFSYATSTDTTKLLIYHDEVFDKNKPERYAAKLYSSDLKLIWSKSFEMSQKDRDVTLGNFLVDKEGVFYMLAKLTETKKEMKEKGKEKGVKSPNYHYEILAYLPSKDEVKVYDLSAGEKFITDIRFELSKDGNLTLAGFYSDKNKNVKGGGARWDKATGVIYMKINRETKEVVTSKFKEFDRNVFDETIKKKKKADKAEELAQFDIDDFIFRDDGGMVMISEQFYIQVVCTTDPKTGATRCTYYYHYDNLLVTNFNPDGSVKWMKIIPKYQVTANDGGYYLSYLTLVNDDKLMFVYNDDPKNATLMKIQDGLRPMMRPKKSQTMLVVLDQNGTFKKQTLFSNKELAVICRPKICNQTGEHEAYIFAEKGSAYRFGKLKF